MLQLAQWRQVRCNHIRKYINSGRNFRKIRKVHTTFVSVGAQAVLQRPPQQQKSTPAKQPRVMTKQVRPQVVCANLQFPAIDDIPLRYQVPHLDWFLQWMRGLEDPSASVTLISWFQISILYDHQMQHPGYRYFNSKKRWLEVTENMKASNFLGRTNIVLLDFFKGYSLWLTCSAKYFMWGHQVWR